MTFGLIFKFHWITRSIELKREIAGSILRETREELDTWPSLPLPTRTTEVRERSHMYWRVLSRLTKFLSSVVIESSVDDRRCINDAKTAGSGTINCRPIRTIRHIRCCRQQSLAIDGISYLLFHFQCHMPSKFWCKVFLSQSCWVH